MNMKEILFHCYKRNKDLFNKKASEMHEIDLVCEKMAIEMRKSAKMMGYAISIRQQRIKENRNWKKNGVYNDN